MPSNEERLLDFNRVSGLSCSPLPTSKRPPLPVTQAAPPRPPGSPSSVDVTVLLCGPSLDLCHLPPEPSLPRLPKSSHSPTPAALCPAARGVSKSRPAPVTPVKTLLVLPSTAQGSPPGLHRQTRLCGHAFPPLLRHPHTHLGYRTLVGRASGPSI